MPMQRCTAVVIFLCVFSSCRTVREIYTLRTEYIADTKTPTDAEVAAGIEKLLSELGIQSISKYEVSYFSIETEWNSITSFETIFFNTAQRLSGSDENTAAFIKYYFTISDAYYSIYAVQQNVGSNSVYTPNSIADVLPNSELWRHMRLLAQKINNNLHITTYRLVTKRERL
jgi:hypothetical protein